MGLWICIYVLVDMQGGLAGLDMEDADMWSLWISETGYGLADMGGTYALFECGVDIAACGYVVSQIGNGLLG